MYFTENCSESFNLYLRLSNHSMPPRLNTKLDYMRLCCLFFELHFTHGFEFFYMQLQLSNTMSLRLNTKFNYMCLCCLFFELHCTINVESFNMHLLMFNDKLPTRPDDEFVYVCLRSIWKFRGRWISTMYAPNLQCSIFL